MIVVIGASNDDILYFENVLTEKKEIMVLNQYRAMQGTMFNQELIVVGGCYSSILTSVILTNILDHNYVDLVICVGKCIAVNKEIKTGDIVISRRIIDANVDLSLFTNVVTGQIPSLHTDFDVQKDILEYLIKGMSRRSFVTLHLVNMLTSDNMSYDMMEHLKSHTSLFGIEDELIALDYNSSGMAVAATLKGVPFISIKVAEVKIDQKNNLNTYLNVLERYIDLGKAVVSTIDDIGRNDILEARK